MASSRHSHPQYRRFAFRAFLAVVSIAAALALTLAPASGGVPESSPSFVNSIGVKMLRIEPGSFWRGERNATPESLKGWDPSAHERGHLPDGDWDEKPVDRVTIDQPFYMSETEITVEQFRAFRPYERDAGKFSPYLSGISWEDAVGFCQWLSKKEGKSYRLPTEAEWEYACRAGTQTLFSSGANVPEHETANAWGLKNMHTGVAEWCLDWHGMYPSSEQVNPVGPEAGVARVVRGGGVQMLSPFYRRSANRAGAPPNYRGSHWIGFRIVEAPMPSTRPLPYEAPFVQQAVKQVAKHLLDGPDPSRPYFKKRPILPIPPENTPARVNQAAGLHPALLGHNHSPGLAVCPNGDLLAVYFTSVGEGSPDSALLAIRLRYGTEEWDMPSLLLDIPDLSDIAPLLWNDNNTMRLFWGSYGISEVPFLLTSSADSGATWRPIQFPILDGPVGGYSPQPINTAFHGLDGRMYVPTDAPERSSVLWSSDDGRIWRDTGGRTAGTHTSFVLLKDGRILGMGGKNTDIDGFMPKAISADGGKTWEVSKTPFAALSTNQRPTLIRLKSGNLFFAGDFQNFEGKKPAGVEQHGSYVALSRDEGETWRIKVLPGALPHEAVVTSWKRALVGHKDGTLGYAVAAQAPNGAIHLITSMNHPSLHFEMNEAWILSDVDISPPERTGGRQFTEQERYPSGKARAVWGAKIAADGRYLLHGKETFFYPDGHKQYEATFENGRKIGAENYWSPTGQLEWAQDYAANGEMTWAQWWSNGQKKSESHWRDGKCQGIATCWDPAGNLFSEERFADGAPVSRR